MDRKGTLAMEARTLLRDGEPIPMAGKTLDMLVVLVQNRGRLVDKDELLSRVWAGTVVEEASLSRSIFTVRSRHRQRRPARRGAVFVVLS